MTDITQDEYAAETLRNAADMINDLPQDYELDPGRGECAQRNS